MGAPRSQQPLAGPAPSRGLPMPVYRGSGSGGFGMPSGKGAVKGQQMPVPNIPQWAQSRLPPMTPRPAPSPAAQPIARQPTAQQLRLQELQRLTDAIPEYHVGGYNA